MGTDLSTEATRKRSLRARRVERLRRQKIQGFVRSRRVRPASWGAPRSWPSRWSDLQANHINAIRLPGFFPSSRSSRHAVSTERACEVPRIQGRFRPKQNGDPFSCLWEEFSVRVLTPQGIPPPGGTTGHAAVPDHPRCVGHLKTCFPVSWHSAGSTYCSMPWTYSVESWKD